MLYADVAVHTDAPYRHPFTYSIPPGLDLAPGQGVLVPFGQRTLQGVVLTVASTTRFEGEVRALLSVATELPLVPAHLLDLARWLGERYLAPLYPCIALMLPPGAERRARVRLIPAASAEGATEAERALLGALRDNPSLDIAQLQRRLHLAGLRRLVDQLVRGGQISRRYDLDPPSVAPRLERRLRLRPSSGIGDAAEPLIRRLREAGGSLPLSVVRTMPEWSERALRRVTESGIAEEVEVRVDRDPLAGHEYPLRAAPSLTGMQSAALGRILQHDGRVDPARARVSLLHGVTGSGKTEVYLAAAAAALSAGARVLMLVPEIALTPQTIERFAGRFPGRVAVLHSGLTDGQRYDQWYGVREGRFDIVVGSRSAIFSPLAPLGLIVIDEEHEWTYKQQDQQPRYQTRDVAERLAALTGASLVLGSATPDVSSYSRAARGRYRLIELPQRVRPSREGGGQDEAMPVVEIVDLARELREGNRGIFSRRLIEALEETLAAGEQAILFVNRRGSAGFLLCRDCGHVPGCRRCAVALTVHTVPRRLLCHQCGRSRQIPTTCPRCGSGRIRQVGLGTQRVEEEVRRRFPAARVLRWDRDSARRGADHAALFERLQRREADVLVGTQIVAKGLDLPGITLVGIVNADLSLNIPEYYSAERAFQLLTQVAGRAGRRERPGRVVLQTYAPNHYAVRAAAAHNYRIFYSEEIEYRRRAGYPPFARLTRLVFSHVSPRRAESEPRRLALHLRQSIAEGNQAGAEVLGPVPCRVARLRGRWRWQVLLRCPRPQVLLRDLELPAGWSVDIDPEGFA